MKLKRITVITGHYGSGKTNLSVNFALMLAKQGYNCTVADLDIVNPYFRAADFKELFSNCNVKLAVSEYANSNLDIPSLSFGINGILSDKNRYLIIDSGGDDAGATALGRFSGELNALYKTNELDMFYVINRYRYLTKTSDEALELMREIETASRLRCTGIINNSNLGVKTTPDDVLNSAEYAEATAEKAALPIAATTGSIEFSDELKDTVNFIPVEIYVKNLF